MIWWMKEKETVVNDGKAFFGLEAWKGKGKLMLCTDLNSTQLPHVPKENIDTEDGVQFAKSWTVMRV